MNEEINALFERDLVLSKHVAGDDDSSKKVQFKNELLDDTEDAEDIEEDYESSVGDEEEEDAKQLEIDTHFDNIFDGIDNPIQPPVQKGINEKFTDLSKELIDEIVTQMEYYFSDENLVDDVYLMKQILANNKDFISLKQFLSFRRMKKLTIDYGVLEHSIKSSSNKLEVNKNRVRRLEEVPKHIRDKHSLLERSVIINSLPSTYLSSAENLKNYFQRSGNVVDTQVYTEMEDVPKVIVEEMRSNKRSIRCPIAIVTYDNVASASKASLELTDMSDWRRGMRVEMVVKSWRKNANVEGVDKENKINDSKQPQKKKNKKNKKAKQQRPIDLGKFAPYQPNNSPLCSPKSSTQNICIPSPSTRQISPLSKSYGTSPSGRNRACFNPLLSFLDGEERGRSNSFGPLSSSPGRWVQKRIDQSKQLVAPLKRIATLATREPKGPDGGKGFTLKRSLPVSMIPLPLPILVSTLPLPSEPPPT